MSSIQPAQIPKFSVCELDSPPVLTLPVELLERIFLHLENLSAVLQVCKAFKASVESSPKLRAIHALFFARKLGLANRLTEVARAPRFTDFLKHGNSEGFHRSLKEITDQILANGDTEDQITLAEIWHKLENQPVARWCLASAQTNLSFAMMQPEVRDNPKSLDNVLCRLLKFAAIWDQSWIWPESILRSISCQKADKKELWYLCLLFDMAHELYKESENSLFYDAIDRIFDAYDHFRPKSLEEEDLVQEGIVKIFSFFSSEDTLEGLHFLKRDSDKCICARRAICIQIRENKYEEALTSLYQTNHLWRYRADLVAVCVDMAIAFFLKGEAEKTRYYIIIALKDENERYFHSYFKDALQDLIEAKGCKEALQFVQFIPNQDEKQRAVKSILIALSQEKRSSMKEIQSCLDQISDYETKGFALKKCIRGLLMHHRFDEADILVNEAVFMIANALDHGSKEVYAMKDNFVSTLFMAADVYFERENIAKANDYLALIENIDELPLIKLAELQLKLGHKVRALETLAKNRGSIDGFSHEEIGVIIALDSVLGGSEIIKKASLYFQMDYQKEYKEIVEFIIEICKKSKAKDPLLHLAMEQAKINDMEGYKHSLAQVAQDGSNNSFRWAEALAAGKNWKEAKALFDEMPEEDNKSSLLILLTEMMAGIRNGHFADKY